jgi:hypothetical protein
MTIMQMSCDGQLELVKSPTLPLPFVGSGLQMQWNGSVRRRPSQPSPLLFQGSFYSIRR